MVSVRFIVPSKRENLRHSITLTVPGKGISKFDNIEHGVHTSSAAPLIMSESIMEEQDPSLFLDEDDSKSGSSNVEKSSSGNGTVSSWHNSASESRRTSTTDDDTNTIKNALAKQETQQVFRLRVLVILILMAAATSISVTIYFIVQQSEIDEFELQYYAAANKIVDAFQEVLVEMSAVSGIAVSVTADTLKANATESWPFVTMSNFQERAGSARKLSGAIYVSVNPIVESDQLSQWERYVQTDVNNWM